MRRAFTTIAAAALLTACGGETMPTEQEQNLGETSPTGEHPEILAQPGPGEANVAEGSITPAERDNVANELRGQSSGEQQQDDQSDQGQEAQAAVGVVQQFGRMLEQRQFGEARQLWAAEAVRGLDEQAFAQRFEGFRTIEAQAQYPRRIAGADGSDQAQVQLTLHGELDGGGAYSRTGIVTLNRAPARWEIVNVRLGPASGGVAGTSN